MHSLGISQSYNPHKTPGIKVLQSFRFWFSLRYKVRSEVTLSKTGLKSLNEAVSVTKAALVWKARKDMDTLGFIFEKKLSIRDNRSRYNDN